MQAVVTHNFFIFIYCYLWGILAVERDTGHGDEGTRGWEGTSMFWLRRKLESRFARNNNVSELAREFVDL